MNETLGTNKASSIDIKILCEQSRKYNYIVPSDFEKYGIKRGLRNADGTGVPVGITRICNVHGYLIDEGERIPQEGQLVYRGVDIRDIIDGCAAEGRYGFEEVVWLLLFGTLPNKEQVGLFQELIAANRVLPDNFVDDLIIKSPSRNIMNKMARSVLALYSYDENPDDISLENVIRQSIEILARLPLIMVEAYQVKRRAYDNKSMYFHTAKANLSISQNILRMLRPNKQFTEDEARLLDLCLILHAEHGGGNNSTFATRVLTSTGTDTYASIAAGIGSLKGFRHGGANHKVQAMLEDMKANIKNYEDEDEVFAYLMKMVNGEVGDGSGLIYGMGHAVYTLSDPRALILKSHAEKLMVGTEVEQDYKLLNLVEKLTPEVFFKKRGERKVLCANVDMYSGLVYQMLGIPPELYTPIFAVARTAGWCAHRIEEIITSSKIIRPAYRALGRSAQYIPLSER
ncbi:citrate/2-methylcitrate synthase [Oscillospiraceae bacterium MB08-C2-2]|nr:citrate/2-methylcitrate synthase [Oscillospiraceae bacterium MB08-C2-2]